LSECKSIEEVRENINRIDREIVGLISQRNRFVGQAAKFKKTTHDVKAPSRVEEVISKVRGVAVEHDLDPDSGHF
jgi:isochorismate pyruvate lyase